MLQNVRLLTLYGIFYEDTNSVKVMVELADRSVTAAPQDLKMAAGGSSLKPTACS